MRRIRSILTYQGVEVWRHTKVTQWTLQIVSGITVVILAVWFFTNIATAVQERGIPHGWNFLDRAYETPIGHTFMEYESSDSFAYVLGLAVVNTAVVSVVGAVLATMLGAAIGVARLSPNWPVSKLATAYIEFFQNVPLLVQLFFWFYIVLALPPVREGYTVGGGLYINNSGLSIPFPDATGLGQIIAWALLATGASVAGYVVFRRMTAREEETGRRSYPTTSGVAAAVAIGAAAWIAVSLVSGEAPLLITSPEPQGRFGRIAGGFTAPAGLVVLLIGLVTYTASFIAEIIYTGIRSIQRGQTEASRALGLTPAETLRHVTIPQALSAIMPRLINQFMNLTKNSSLASAVGYPDLTNIAKTMTQTAPAVSIFLLIAAAYLTMGLTYTLIGHLYSRYIGVTES